MSGGSEHSIVIIIRHTRLQAYHYPCQQITVLALELHNITMLFWQYDWTEYGKNTQKTTI